MALAVYTLLHGKRSDFRSAVAYLVEAGMWT
jgi:hypothetical protein